MSELAKTYDPASVEEKWYTYWETNGFFRSVPDQRKPYTIVIPPPNVTGVLHMGHMLNNTIQDVLIRRKRMQGYNACWVPGTDHASIATEAKVVRLLREEGLTKAGIGREKFLERAFEWKEKYGGIILQQLRKLGASCDWERTRFTMEPELSESVINVFIDLYKKGYIYRGLRMINWDSAGKTALSDEEVIHKEVNGKLYHLRYLIEGTENQYVVIATTRPETILADTAVAVHPEDERYQHLIGKNVILPFIGRKLPIIADDYVEREFGTGCLKVTPAHDMNDYEIGQRHNLAVINILNEDGTLAPEAELYVGQDRFEVRKQIVKDLEEAGHVVKIEEMIHKVGFSERTDAVVEPRLSLQWFVKMEKLAEPALKAVLEPENDGVNLIPKRYTNTYRHWMENVRDWCISRQLWWGHRIPAWYFGAEPDQYVIAKTQDEAFSLAQAKGFTGSANDLKQDDDVLDTWFSSWLWPLSVFNGINKPNNPDVQYYYPTDDLVTAPEILFFWVARMIMSGYEYAGQRPFKNVYLTGIVRDKQGRKMSKSLGNSPDPLDLIAKHGADGVRMGMLMCSPAGNDLPFDESLCEQGRNFCNKVWNAFRLIMSLQERQEERPLSDTEELALAWMEARLNQVAIETDDLYEQFRLSEAVMTIYKLVWDDFCSWYLELIKPPFEGMISTEAYYRTVNIMESLLKILHPVMPFITEELFHGLRERSAEDCIIVAKFVPEKEWDSASDAITEMEDIRKLVTQLRAFRAQKNLSPKEPISLFVKTTEPELIAYYMPVIAKLVNISEWDFADEKVEGSNLVVVDTHECFIPLTQEVDIEAERTKITDEITYLEGFLASVLKKLENENFVSKAKPEVIENERKKKADAEAKLQVLKESLVSLV